MDKPGKYYVKWNMPYTKGQILYDPIYMRQVGKIGKFIETSSCWGLLGGKTVELWFNKYRIPVWHEWVREMDSGDDCATLSMSLMPLSCTLEDG